MKLFRPEEPVKPVKPQKTVRLVEYLDYSTGKKHWDVFFERMSITDDYGFSSLEEARAAYVRKLAIERGEIKVGLSKVILEEAMIP